MSNFIIFRAEKHKSAIGLRNSLKHAMREQPTPNADPERLDDNHYFTLQNGDELGAKTVDEAMKAYESKLPAKVRKNAVHCLEFLVSGSPEQMAKLTREQQINFFASATNYIAKKFGGMKNIIHAQIHFDETTPHLTVFAVPIDEKGALNARKFVGGSKFVLSQLQTEIAEEVGEKYGLARGIKKIKPDDHIPISEYHKIVANFDKFIRNPSVVSESFIYRLAQDMAKIESKKGDEKYIKGLEEELKSIQSKYGENPQRPNKEYMNYSNEERKQGESVARYHEILTFLEKKNPEFLEKEKIEQEYLSDAKKKAFIGVGRPETFLGSFINIITQKAKEDIENNKKKKEEEDKKHKAEIETLKNEKMKAVQESRKKRDELRNEIRQEFKDELTMKDREITKLNSEISNLKEVNRNNLEQLRKLSDQEAEIKNLQEELTAKSNELITLKQNVNSSDWLMKQYEKLNNQKTSTYKFKM